MARNRMAGGQTRSSNAGNPRSPSASDFVRGGEQKNREVRLNSPITLFRRADPDNPKLANFAPNFVFDYTEQKKEVPVGIHDGQGTRGPGSQGRTTMNENGKPCVFGGLMNAVVGAGQDDKGNY